MYTGRLWYSRLCTAAAYAPGAYCFSTYGPHAYESALIIHVTVASGQWAVASGKWMVGSGQWPVANLKF